MGGCATKPRELDGSAPANNSIVDREVTVKPVEAYAPQEEVKAETTTSEDKNKEEPLVDLSSPKAVAENSPVVELAPEISELNADVPVKAEPLVVKDDAPAKIEVAPAVEEKVVEEKVEEVREPAVVADAEEEKVSA